MKFLDVAKQMNIHPDTLYTLITGKGVGRMFKITQVLVLPQFKSKIQILDRFNKFNTEGLYLMVAIPDEDAMLLIKEFEEFSPKLKKIVSIYDAIARDNVFINDEYIYSLKQKYHMLVTGIIESYSYGGKGFQDKMYLNIKDAKYDTLSGIPWSEAYSGDEYISEGTIVVPKVFRKEDDFEILLRPDVTISFTALNFDYTPLKVLGNTKDKIFYLKPWDIKVIDIPLNVQRWVVKYQGTYASHKEELRMKYEENKK